MSFQSTAVNANTLIARLYDILSNSPSLFPNRIGGNTAVQDLVRQVIQYELPFPEQPREGDGPPHIFITPSKQANPIFRQKLGRGNINQLGPERQIWEIYLVAVHHDVDVNTTEQVLHDICQAITETLDTNKRLLDHTGTNPLVSDLEWINVPYLLDVAERSVLARNIVVRASVFVNMRTS